MLFSGRWELRSCLSEIVNNYLMKFLQSNQIDSISYKGDDVVLSLLRDGLLVINSTNQVIEANEHAAAIFGLTSCRELLGRSLSEFYADPDEAENFVEILEEYKEISDWQNTFIKVTGPTFVAAYSARFIPDTGVKVILIRDISIQTQAIKNLSKLRDQEEKLRQEFDQFTYIVSHDLKAPLRAISNLSEWIQDDINNLLTEDGREKLDLLRSRVGRMEAMISGLAEYSRMGRIPEAVEKVNVMLLLLEIINDMQPASGLEIELPKELPALKAPRGTLRSIFFQLIQNAIRFNKKDRKVVRIYYTEKNSHYEFIIEDNGPGIAPEYQEKVFDLFHTLQPKDVVETTGIGLTLVRRNLKAFGEDIRIESEPGYGSKFIFTWSMNSL